MSDEKPFARVETTFRGKGTESERMVRVLLCDESSLLWPGRPVGEIVSALNAAHNSAVAAERREAAVKALREAASAIDDMGKVEYDDFCSHESAWLRSRAADLEGGAS